MDGHWIATEQSSFTAISSPRLLVATTQMRAGRYSPYDVCNPRSAAVLQGVGDPLLGTLIGGDSTSRLGHVVWGLCNNEVGGRSRT